MLQKIHNEFIFLVEYIEFNTVYHFLNSFKAVIFNLKCIWQLSAERFYAIILKVTIFQQNIFHEQFELFCSFQRNKQGLILLKILGL